jgi:hypothetical protein
VAGLVLALFMREGTPLAQLPTRMAWLAQDPIVWKLGWIVWMLAALCVGGLYAGLAGALGKPPRALWALAMACAGAAADIFSEIIYISVLPGVAQSGNRDLFLAFERTAFGGGCVLANSFYTIGVWLIALELKRQKRTNLWLDLSAAITVACGLAMTVGGILQRAELLEVFTGPTIVGFSVWGLLAARAAMPRITEINEGTKQDVR